MTDIDPRVFRDAASQFMTGVTVITTVDDAGSPAGFTANSFSTVSLAPPLVSFCLGGDSVSRAAFEDGNGFIVHVLGTHQQDIAVRFAAKGIDRFAGVEWGDGLNDLPLLSGALATFECETVHAYDGGDHVLYLGEVKRLGLGDGEAPALGYFRGGYVSSPEPIGRTIGS